MAGWGERMEGWWWGVMRRAEAKCGCNVFHGQTHTVIRMNVLVVSKCFKLNICMCFCVLVSEAYINGLLVKAAFLFIFYILYIWAQPLFFILFYIYLCFLDHREYIFLTTWMFLWIMLFQSNGLRTVNMQSKGLCITADSPLSLICKM